MLISDLSRLSLTDSDVDNINNLLKQLTDKPKSYDRYGIKRLARQRNVFVHVITDGPKNEIVGMAVLKVDDGRMFTQNYKKAYIGDVVVDSNYRGRGIAEKLMHSLMILARKLNAKYVSLTSNPNNPNRAAAIRLYERIVFKKIGELNGSNYYRMELKQGA